MVPEAQSEWAEILSGRRPRWGPRRLVASWRVSVIVARDRGLSIIAADNPGTCAIYARENNLLDLDGWKWFKHIVRQDKKFLCMVNQAKSSSIAQCCTTSMVMKFHGITTMPSNLTSAMATPSGKTLLPLR